MTTTVVLNIQVQVEAWDPLGTPDERRFYIARTASARNVKGRGTTFESAIADLLDQLAYEYRTQ